MNDNSLPRLLRGASGRPLALDQHEKYFGPLATSTDVTSDLETAGLRGRGGAAFPTHLKVKLIRDDHARHKYVVVNAMEGEPAAHKDQSLLGVHPHLVLDGAQLLAQAVGARDVAVCVARENTTAINHVERAMHERQRRSRHGVNFELHTPPGRYIAGEESALVHWLDDNETLPQYRPTKPSILRIGRGSVLVDNAETHANVALIARYGPQWFRAFGTSAHPGTTLVSISGAIARPVVLEVALGTPLREILRVAGAASDPLAVLLGGYGGTWLDARHLDTPYDIESLSQVHATVGAGVIIVLGHDGCGITETYNIARWMANESARQCGPCAFGLPALADSLGQIALGGRDRAGALDLLRERAGLIVGRGACRHPDGVVRLVESALVVFGSDIAAHVDGRPCAGAGRSRYATVPRLELEHELVWE